MINVADISSVYNNLICPRSKLQENIEYISIEDDDYDKKNYEDHGNGEHRYWNWFKQQYRWNERCKE